MKSIKIVAIVAAGLVSLGAFSAQAAGVLNINVTTYVQAKTTNADGSVTFTRTAVTIKNADLLAKVGHALGITMPAGATLALSTMNDTLNDINPGDVLINDASGHVLWNLARAQTAIGQAEVFLNVHREITQDKNATKSTTHTFYGEGEFFFDIFSYDVDAEGGAGIGCFGDFFDNQLSGQDVQGKFGNRHTTGTCNFAGGGEFVSFIGNNDFFDRVSTYQAANCSVFEAYANVPGNPLDSRYGFGDGGDFGL